MLFRMGFQAGQYDIYTLIGERLTVDFELYSDNTQTQHFPLAGYTVQVNLTLPGPNGQTLVLTDGDGLDVNLADSIVSLDQDTSSWIVGRGRYSLELVDPDGRATYPMRGIVFTGTP